MAAHGGMNGPMEEGAMTGLIGWGILYASIALAHFLATLATFDRCLGRTPERPFAPGIDAKPDPDSDPDSEPGRLIGQAMATASPSKARVGEFDEWEVDRRLVP